MSYPFFSNPKGLKSDIYSISAKVVPEGWAVTAVTAITAQPFGTTLQRALYYLETI